MSKTDALAKLVKLLEDEVRYDTYDDYDDDIVREKPEVEQVIDNLRKLSPDDSTIETLIMSFIVQYSKRARDAFFDDDPAMEGFSRDLVEKFEKILMELNPEITKKHIEVVIRDFRAREEYDSESYHDSPPEDEDEDYDFDEVYERD